MALLLKLRNDTYLRIVPSQSKCTSVSYSRCSFAPVASVAPSLRHKTNTGLPWLLFFFFFNFLFFSVETFHLASFHLLTSLAYYVQWSVCRFCLILDLLLKCCMKLPLSFVAKQNPYFIVRNVENTVWFVQDDWQLMPNQGIFNEFSLLISS